MLIAEDSLGAYFGAAERGVTSTALGLTSDTEGPVSMPKADQTRITSNRSALHPTGRWPQPPRRPGSPNPKPLPLPNWLLEPAKPDGKSLGELCTQFRSEFAFYCRRMDELKCELDDDIMSRSISRREQLLAAIIATPADDIEGLKAKASVMLAYTEVIGPGGYLDRQLATSIAQDIVLAA